MSLLYITDNMLEGSSLSYNTFKLTIYKDNILIGEYSTSSLKYIKDILIGKLETLVKREDNLQVYLSYGSDGNIENTILIPIDKSNYQYVYRTIGPVVNQSKELIKLNIYDYDGLLIYSQTEFDKYHYVRNFLKVVELNFFINDLIHKQWFPYSPPYNGIVYNNIHDLLEDNKLTMSTKLTDTVKESTYLLRNNINYSIIKDTIVEANLELGTSKNKFILDIYTNIGLISFIIDNSTITCKFGTNIYNLDVTITNNNIVIGLYYNTLTGVLEILDGMRVIGNIEIEPYIYGEEIVASEYYTNTMLSSIDMIGYGAYDIVETSVNNTKLKYIKIYSK